MVRTSCGVISLTMTKREYILMVLIVIVAIALIIVIRQYVEEVKAKNGGHFFKPKVDPPPGNPTVLNMTRIIRAGEPGVG